MTVLIVGESRFQIVFDKLSEVRPEQWAPALSEAALRGASEEIAELRRELLEIVEPPVSLFTTT